jgi:hypothetical protein
MPLASGRVPVQYMTLPGGNAGTDGTVALMRKLAVGRYGSRSPKIRALAINILRRAGVPEKDYLAETVALHNWVRDNIRYTRDVAGQETLSPPEEVAFNTKAGDCDDKSILLAALLGAVGIVTRFKVLGVTRDRYSHVYLQANVNGQWMTLDPIMKDKPAGWEAPAHMRALEKTYPENIPEGMNMQRNVNGLGYVADPRIVSHLEDEPGSVRRANTPYVAMNSFLDNDAPIEQLSNNSPAFPQDQNMPPVMPRPRLQQVRPILRDMRNRLASRSVVTDEAEAYAHEHAAMNPGHGMNDVMLPEQLAAMGVGEMDQQPLPYMQRDPLVVEPEGIDVMYGRNALVMRGDRGDRINYRGLWALSEQPPIRRIEGVGGGPRSMVPGMGYLGRRSASGPGLADLADATEAAQDPNATAPAARPGLGLVGLLALAAGVYILCRK